MSRYKDNSEMIPNGRVLMHPIDRVVESKIDQLGASSWVLSLGEEAKENIESALDELEASVEGLETDKDFVLEVISAVTRCRQELGALNISVSETLPPIDLYQRPVDYRAHVIHDVNSLIDFTKKYGDPEKTIIFYTNRQIQLVLDETIEVGKREIVLLQFDLTEEYSNWEQLIGNDVSHKQLVKHLSAYLNTLKNPHILDSLRKVSYKQSIDTNSEIQEYSNEFGVMFKTDAGEDLLKLPKQFAIHLPILAEDVLDEALWVECTIRVVPQLPDTPQGGLSFSLLCSEWPTLVRKRTANVAENLRDNLDQYTIVRGTCKTETRNIGPEARPKEKSSTRDDRY